jgi:endonuclease/exonuclease/phosphatase family metal-dependent hydrolase
MSRAMALFALTILVINSNCMIKAPDKITVMTFNVRYGTAKDSLNSWPYRKDIFINCIRNNKPDILCVQEALALQIAYVRAAFPSWQSIGIGRYHGVAVPERPNESLEGESCTIFYDSTKFALLDNATFWHSDTPEIPASRTWDNSLPRITTWGQFRDKASGRPFVVMNTHYHTNEPYLIKTSELMVRRWRQIAGKLPTIFTGDFNQDPASQTHRLFCGQSGPAESLGEFRDCWQVLGRSEKNAGTSHNFSDRTDKARIDWILVTKQFVPRDIKIIYDNEQGRYPSDHYPVRAELILADE